VAAVNEAVREVPSLLHRDPYRRAWLVDVRPDGSDHTRLPSGRQARAWLAREDERLTRFLEHQLGIAAADGGDVMVPPHRLLSPEQWDAVRRGFLTDDEVERSAARARDLLGSPGLKSRRHDPVLHRAIAIWATG
jgi:glycine cleavage system H protein